MYIAIIVILNTHTLNHTEMRKSFSCAHYDRYSKFRLDYIEATQVTHLLVY